MSINQSYLVLDTISSTYNTSSQNSTYPINANSVTTCPNSFNTVWTLTRPLRNVAKIYLKTLTLPVLFPNVRSSNNSNTLTVTSSANVPYTITLPDRVFKDVQSLITRINAEFTALYPTQGISFSLYTLEDITQCYGYVAVTSASLTSISVKPSILAKMLGFSNPASDILVSGNTKRVASGSYNLNYDNYLNMTIYTTPDHNMENQNGTPVSFHIPVPVSSDTIMFTSSNLSFDGYVQNYQGTVINTIGIVITDRFGFSINARNADYSLCLALEYYN